VDGTGGVPQDFRLLRHYAHGAKQVFSADRWALTGDAGAFLDPFYSPGSDFISISNTYITELVCRSLDGSGIRIAASVYEKAYQTFYASGLSLYEGQYPLFGNPAVMPLKILWDYTYYWAVSGPLYFTGQLTAVDVLLTGHRSLTKAVQLNKRMQEFFRQWDRVEDSPVSGRFLDCAAAPTPWELNARLREPVVSSDVVPRLRANVRLLEEVAAEIASVARRRHQALPAPVARPATQYGAQHGAHLGAHLGASYDVLGLTGDAAADEMCA
jgi:hypothetical protein